VFGGAQSLHTNSYDEALGLPTEESVTIALRTQQIIAEETGVTKTVDPLGGSYYLETLTDEIEAKALEELGRVEKLGGALEAIKMGYIQREIQKSAYQYQKAIDEKEKIIIGVNKHVSDLITPIGIQKISEKSVKNQLDQITAFRKSRNKLNFEIVISKLQEEASKEPMERKNLIPFVIDAVKAGATTGEISDSMRLAYGEYHPRQIV